MLFRSDCCLTEGEDHIKTIIDLVDLAAAPLEEVLTVAINDTANTLFYAGIAGVFCHYSFILTATDLIFIRFVRLYHVTRCLAHRILFLADFERVKNTVLGKKGTKPVEVKKDLAFFR
jgi:hypothetical protein